MKAFWALAFSRARQLSSVGVDHIKRSPVSLAGLIAVVATVLLRGSLSAGIPEPDLVWYGKVLTASGGNTIRLTSGLLVWQIEPLAGGTPWTLSTRLTNINDQFSFVLHVPCETPEPGITASTGTVVLTTPPANYRRMTVTLDGQPLTLHGASNQFAPAFVDRGRAERIDLALGTLPADTDGNGLADNWEMQYFGQIGVDPGADPDGDRLTNLQEFRAGTNPTNAQSRFAIIEIHRFAGGTQIRWSSQPERSYRVRRSTVLSSSANDYQTIQAGIAATPPMNEFLDTSATGATFFYRIQLED